jgi:ligand-binding sensor domain-containing protein
LSLYQDTLGFIWIGTFEGLKRFDGHQFKTYKHIPGDEHSLNDNSINEISEDKAGRMWINTNKGHNLYQPKTDSFKPFERNPPEFLSTKNPNIRQILTDNNSLIWAVTQQGLFQFNPQARRLKKYQSTASTVFEGHNKTLWIGTLNGDLLKYNRATDVFLAVDIGDKNASAITDIKQDNNGALWLGTDGAGLLQLNPTRKSVTHHQHNPNTLEGQTRNKISSLLFGTQGVLWVRSSGGLDIFANSTKTFTSQLKGQWVVKFFRTKQCQLWLLLNDLPVGDKTQFDDHNPSKWSKRLALYDQTSQSFKMYLSSEILI